MKNRTVQGMISGGLIVAALAVVGVFTLRERDDGTISAGGHDHAAMASRAGAARPVTLDAEGARRIGVAYATVESGPLARTVRTVGTVAYDETRLVEVNSKIEGWVERLFVDFTGAPVERGQPLMTVYSPMLVAAQEELLLAARLAGSAPAGPAGDDDRQLLEAARRRLVNWDVSAEEIARIEATGMPERTVTLRAPANGVVVEKSVVEGARIMPGMDLYRIADLSGVWIEGEVFEKDLGVISTGREATVSFDAFPGRSFAGRISYIHPTVAQETRTGRIRIELPNPGLQLKPGMYANVALDVPLHLTGLHVPRAAVLTTGTRSLVFVQHPDGSLVPHEVTIGQAAGDHLEILAGLSEGQVVVASAGFLVDAESHLGSALQDMSGAQRTDGSGAAAGAQRGH
jgi:membrane fusion protein, copper/silver efflux system